VNKQVYDGMIVMPADQHCINAQNEIKDTGAASVHINEDYDLAAILLFS
jgi:hypothetical protein